MSNNGNQELRIGVFVCNCGTNIANVVDCDAVANYVKEVDGVVVAESYKYMCSNPGQEMVANAIKEHNLNRVVVAACSPRMHEETFRTALKTAGINPYFFEMANIREQCSWVHENKVAATEKAKALTHAAIERVRFHEPLEKREVDMCPRTLVIGGGIAGMTVALELADAGQKVILVEQTKGLGGNVARVDSTAPYFDSARDLIQGKIIRVMEHDSIDVMLESKVDEIKGFIGNFNAFISKGGSAPAEHEVGSVIVCTGYKEFDASRAENLGYGKLPRVVTSFEFEQMLKAGKLADDKGKLPRYVSIVHCVGSRSEEFNPYCSRVCCMTALKYAREIKSAVPESMVTDIYIDMHAFGKGCEDFYRASSDAKTMFLMYGKNELPRITPADPKKDGCEMLINVNEQLSSEKIEIPADLVVLLVGMEPRDDAGEVARLTTISQGKDGWFIEAHPKLDPVATATEGVYIAGCCQGPKDIPDTVAQAQATAVRVLANIAREKLEIDAIGAEVDEDMCSGCRVCNWLCPYSAIEYDEEKEQSYVIDALCKACGTCVAACPSGAIKARHFTDEQIFAQIKGVLV